MILEQGSHMLGPVIYAQRPFLWFYQWLLYGKTASLTAVEALNKTSVPVLIVHGTADTVVDYYGNAIINKKNGDHQPQGTVPSFRRRRTERPQ